MKFICKLLILMAFIEIKAVSALDVPNALVDSSWVEQHLDQVTILEISKKTDDFKNGHLPTARFIDGGKINVKLVEEGVEYDRMRPSAEALTKLMRDAAVNQHDAIVIATVGQDSTDITLGTRLLWILKYYSHSNVALLNGGVAKWIADGKPVSTMLTPPTQQGDFTAGAEQRSLLATTSDVQAAVEQGSPQLLDTRTLDYYLGTAQRKYVFGKGHIPSAKHFPHNALVHWESQPVFIDPHAIETALQAMGIDTHKPIIAYCNSGHLSTGVWFVLSELLGKHNVASYDGSMHAWTKDPARPLVSMKME